LRLDARPSAGRGRPHRDDGRAAAAVLPGGGVVIAAEGVTRSRRRGHALYRALPAPDDQTTPQEVGPEARDDCGQQDEGAARRDEHGEGHQRAELDVEAEAREAGGRVAEGDRGGGEAAGFPRPRERAPERGRAAGAWASAISRSP